MVESKTPEPPHFIPRPASTQGQGTSGSSGISDADVAKAQLASSSVSLGIVSSLSDGVATSPEQGVLAIDELIMKSKQQDPKYKLSPRVTEWLSSGIGTALRSEPQLREYVRRTQLLRHRGTSRPRQGCIGSEPVEEAIPLAQVVPQKSDDPSTVPIVVSFFDMRSSSAGGGQSPPEQGSVWAGTVAGLVYKLSSVPYHPAAHIGECETSAFDRHAGSGASPAVSEFGGHES